MNILQILSVSGLQFKETATGQYVVKECPFCPDTKGKADNYWKLYLNQENGLFLCHRCQVKGNTKQFAEKLGYSDRNERRFNMVDQYLYQDESGCTHVRVTRLEDDAGGKTFYQERLENGTWRKGGTTRPLQPYRYAEWERETSIIIVEGEKCVQAARNLGLPATTFTGGCHGWKASGDKEVAARYLSRLSRHCYYY